MQRQGTGNFIAQLTDVAWPGVSQQAGQRVIRQPGPGVAELGGHVHQQLLRNRRDVGHALAQRRHGDADAREPVIQIFAEQAVAHALLQLAVGGGNDAHVHLNGAHAPHGPHLALLQHAQQLDLERRRGFANFIQKHGAAVATLEQAWVVLERAGKRPALVAEQLRLQQRVGNGRAVFHHKRPRMPGRCVMNGACQQLFARTRLTQHHDRDVVPRHALGHLAHVVQRAAWGAHDALEAKVAAGQVHLAGGALTQHPRAGAQLQIKAAGLLLQRLGLHGVAHAVQ